MLALETGADTHVIELFAFFHDSRRSNEFVDDGHASRAAALARQLMGRLFDATEPQMDLLLQVACNRHSDGLNTRVPTVLTCRDADRLDLGRVRITSNPESLWTTLKSRMTTYKRPVRGL